MKKALCMLLAVLLAAALCATAPAEGNNTELGDPFAKDEPKAGIRFVPPEKYRNLKGFVVWNIHYLDDGILQLTPSYFAFPKEDYFAYNEYSDEWFDALMAGKSRPRPRIPSG